MSAYVDASIDMDSLDSKLTDYPSPSSFTESTPSAEPEQQTKKKRKAWGQPVPPINPILPPRKRAKTAEEKEQRRNERILRNRRAADKSRQRQKAAVAELEQRQHCIEADNQKLMAILTQYETRFGKLPGCDFTPSVPQADPTLLLPASTITTQDETTPQDPVNLPTPVLTASTPATSFYQESPSLVPALNLGEPSFTSSPVNFSGMTQYPAAVLCDLQCQPETLTSRLRSMQPNQQFYEVLTLIHSLTTWMTFSETMPLIKEAFQFLIQILSTSTQLDSLIRHNFHLIHILISMPSTTTQPAIFRSKLLSRLLACNPELARLLETAADESLQRAVSKDNWAEDAESRWTWSSLMTIRWNIRQVERDHQQIRDDIRAGVLDREKWSKAPGIDWKSVEATVNLWEGMTPESSECITITKDEPKLCSPSSTEVH